MIFKRLISKIKTSFSASRNAYILFTIVLIVNLIQSVFTDLLNDEPYYYVYSQYLNWGYFDHPPLIGLLIELGKFIPGELGARFFCAIFGSFTFFFIYKLIELESPSKSINYLIYLILCSSIFLNVYSFLAIPDTPLLFFSTLFLYSYRSYLKTDKLYNVISLAIVASLLLYSKYHGILIIG